MSDIDPLRRGAGYSQSTWIIGVIVVVIVIFAIGYYRPRSAVAAPLSMPHCDLRASEGCSRS